MSQSVREQVRQIAADVFNLPLDQIKDDLSSGASSAWDSVQHLNFVLAMEAQLRVQFEPAEIESMQDIGSAIGVAERRVAARDAR